MRWQLGFNLIEVMIALVVLSLGALGMAALQMTSIQQNQSAYMRSQATQLAYDIADRMRSNAGTVNSYLQDATGTEDSDCISYSGSATGCSAAEMAGNDLFEWYATIARELTNGSGRICRSDLAGDAEKAPDCESNNSDEPVVIYIWWDDISDGGVTQVTVSTEL